MWYRLFLLLLYFLFLFTLARLLEIVSWYGGTGWCRHIVDPMSLSVNRLKAILETRGIGYDGAVEKQDLSELIDATGMVSGEEMMKQIKGTDGEPSGTLTNFTHGLHFLEEVEDKKDSVWLVQVKTDHRPGMLLSEAKWSAVRKKLSRFGIRAGMFDCNFDYRLCSVKRWTTPRLILALPGGFTNKGNVSFYTYEGQTDERSIIQWVKDKMAARVTEIKSRKDLQKNWLSYRQSDKSYEIRVIFFAKLAVLPFFLSALSFKFPGRVRFAVVSSRVIDKMDQELDYTAPSYIVVSRDRKYRYGLKLGEFLTYRRMELFLKTLYPEINDIFLVILFISNWLSWLELVLCRHGPFRRFLRLLWYLIKYNCIVLVTVLPTIALFRLPYMNRLVLLSLKCLQRFGTTSLAAFFRNDLSLYRGDVHLFLVATALFSVAVALFECLRLRGSPEPRSDWLDFTPLMTSNQLLSPLATFSPFGVSVYPNDTRQIELVNDHITNPSLWLRPAIDPGYVPRLPTWNYCEVGDAEMGYGENDPAGDLGVICGVCCRGGCSVDGRVERVGCSSGSCLVVNAQPVECEICGKLLPCGVSLSSDPEAGQVCGRRDGVRQVGVDESCRSGVTGSVAAEEGSCDNHGGKFCEMERVGCGCEKYDGAQGANDPKHANQPVFPEGYLANSNCVICLDQYKVGVTLCGLPCGHSFHDNCIFQWLSRDNHFCPVCRWPSYKPKAPTAHFHEE